MKIGILSDSHGNLERLEKAVSLLAEQQAEALVHCGDIVEPESFEVLASADVPAYAVAGNMDKQTEPLSQAAERTGVHFSPSAIEVPLGNGRFLVALHGDDETRLEEYIRSQQFPYVCHGHTHRVRNEQYDQARVINPGALYKPKGPARGQPTCVLLDTESDSVAVIEVAG
ncbi:MAG: metallophosphoesterase family protein [Phycisphaerae bacterium]